MKDFDERLKKTLEDTLPPMVARKDIGKYGLPYSSRYLANLDSTHAGPGLIKIGARACYEKHALIEWLMARIG